MRSESPPLVWETDLPLFSRLMLTQWTVAMLVTGLLLALILGTIFAAQQEWDVLLPMAGMIAAVTAGLWSLGLLIMATLFRGRYRVRYELSGEGLRCDTLDKVARRANRLAIGLGAATGNARLLGAGLIGISRESEAVKWSGALRIRCDPIHHRVMLRNGWRNLLWVQCTPANYQEVAARAGALIEHHCGSHPLPLRSPLTAYLGRTVLVFLACAPLFALAQQYHSSLLVPICTLCFGLATVWLINLFAWVVLASLAVQIALVVVAQFEQRQSFIDRGEFYRAYQVLGGDDLGLLLLTGLGAAGLIWLCLGALRGRWLAALVADQSDMGNA